MNSKKIFSSILAPLLLVIGLFLIVIGGKELYQSFFSKGPTAGDKKVQEALAQSQEFKAYEEVRSGVSFQYPRLWTVKPIQNGTSFSTLYDAVNIRVSVDDFSKEKEPVTPASYRELTKKQLEQLSKEAQITYTPRDEGTTTIAALPAYEWTYSLQVQKVPIGGAQVWFVKDKKVFVMTYTAPAQLFDSFYSIYKKMVESISAS